MNIYTDGASSNNQTSHLREGGFAFLLCYPDNKVVYYCYEKGATNNQMELKGLLYAVKELKALDIDDKDIHIYTDSRSVIGCYSGNKINKNKELIFETNKYIAELNLQITFHYVPGHSGDENNEICDTFAKQAIEEKNSQIIKQVI
jgi:ribonuclease HI